MFTGNFQPTRVPATSVLGLETPHNLSVNSVYRDNMAYISNETSPQGRAMPTSTYQSRQMPTSAYSQRSLGVAASEVPVNASSQHIQTLSFQPAADTSTYMSRVDGRPAAPILKAPGFDYLNWKSYDKVRGCEKYNDKDNHFARKCAVLAPYVRSVVVSACQGREQRLWANHGQTPADEAKNKGRSSLGGSRASLGRF